MPQTAKKTRKPAARNVRLDGDLISIAREMRSLIPDLQYVALTYPQVRRLRRLLRAILATQTTQTSESQP